MQKNRLSNCSAMALCLVLSWTLLAVADAARPKLYRVDSDDVGKSRRELKKKHKGNSKEQKGRQRNVHKTSGTGGSHKGQDDEMLVRFNVAEREFMASLGMSMSMTLEPVALLCNGRTLDQRYDDLEEIVLGISGITHLIQGSAQNDAFEWLANVDEARVCPEDIRDVQQRYIMALFYYSTGGDSWIICSATMSSSCPSVTMRFLSRQDVCFWNGVSCNRGDISGISIDENDLDGELPEEFGKLSQLVDLDFDANFKIRGNIPVSLSLLTRLETFDLDNNILVGEIPESFYDCSALESLDLDHNMLTGTLSSRFSDMSNLNLLFLDNNMLSGSLPSEWGNTLGGLKFLTLDSNMLTGTIPATYAALRQLRILTLHNNKNIHGPIPDFIGDFEDLELLSLFNSNLSGPIPTTLGRLKGLRNLFIHNTDLTGTMPQEICDMRHHAENDGNQLMQLVADCGGHNPKVICDASCCTGCFS